MTNPVPSKELIAQIRADAAEFDHPDEILNKADLLFLLDEIERLRAALTGISTCSTCEVCREAATLALGEDVTKINAAVDERLDRVERELADGLSGADHPKNDWQCGSCSWMNFGSRTSCGHCETPRAAQPPGDGGCG